LWRSVVENFVLDEHELVLLRQAVHVADSCDDLQRVVEAEGPLVGGRAHPALVELRQQRIVLARLIVALRVPLGDTDQETVRAQHRGVRGAYALRGVS
jgi:hypothetical protein